MTRTSSRTNFTWFLRSLLFLLAAALFVLPNQSEAAFPVVAGTNNSNDGSTSNHTVDLPSSISAGDLLLIFFSYDANQGDFQAVSGWSTVEEFVAAVAGFALYARVADGTEGSTVTVTTAGNSNSVHQTYRITGTTGDVEATSDDNASHDPPSLTPSWGSDDTLWIAALTLAEDFGEITGAPSSYTNLISTSRGDFLYLGTARRELAASSENPGAFSASGGGAEGVVEFTVGVKPAAAAPDAPTNLTTTSTTGGVDLSWTAPASSGGSNLETYGVWRATSPFTAVSSATLITSFATSTGTTYSDTSATHGTSYYYGITATNSTATSSLSNQIHSGSNSGRVIRLGGLLRAT